MDINDPNIPDVGNPGAIMMWYPTVIIHCKCVRGKLSMVVCTGFQNYVACGNCLVQYCITGMNPDGSLNIGYVIPAPKGSVM